MDEGRGTGDVGSVSPAWRRLSDEIASAHAVEPVSRAWDDLALLSYTSGSTGRPRGVMVTHGNLWWGFRIMDEICATQLRDVTLVTAPLAHLGGFNGFGARALVRGGTVAIDRGFDPAVCLRQIEQLRVTTMFAVPSMLEELRRHPAFPSADLSSLRIGLVGGAMVPAELLVDFARRGVQLVHAWGMTESVGVCLYLPPERTLERPTSVGIATPYVDVVVVDPQTGEVSRPDAIGELAVRGPCISPGYWRDPERSATTFRDGWLHTGDLARRDADGWFTMAGRAKDMIISGGENIYPAEVEEALGMVAGIRDAMVVGVPDATWGETVMAVVVLDPGVSIALDQLRDRCAANIARYKLPRHLKVVDRIPLNSSGKPDRVAVRAAALQELDPTQRDVAPPSGADPSTGPQGRDGQEDIACS
jgi:fatty-acyl-CoA synthase